MNIQHIESLNDVVAQITRIRVRETIPDRVVDEANEIELVDTTADDLLERLKDGKVYVKAQAERALKHFFQPGNLTALRELALRKAAQHVDRDMVDYMQAHAIGGPWPASEHVLVCISEQAFSAELVRRARRLADSLKAPLTTVYIESPRHLSLGEVEKDRIADTLRLAQRLGAEIVTLPGRDIAATILDYARKKNVTQIVIGKSERPRWFEMLHGSVVRDLMRESGAISVTAVLATGDAVAPKTVKTAPAPDDKAWRRYGLSLTFIVLTTGAGWLLRAITSQALESIGMLFLVPVMASAVSVRPAPRLVHRLHQPDGVQLLLPAAALHFHHRRSQQLAVLQCPAVRGGDLGQPGGAGARPGRPCLPACRHRRRAVQFHRQDGGHCAA